MIPDSLSPVANHLWQSTLFAGAAGLVVLSLRKNAARVRYWVWVAASFKFLAPFALLLALGSHLPLRVTTAPRQAFVTIALDGVSQPFAPAAPFSKPASPQHSPAIPIAEILVVIWGCGFLGITASWLIRWRRIAAAVQAGSPVKLALPIQGISSPLLMEPGVFGIVHPVLLLPEGIEARLSAEEFSAIVSHELEHVRHRDNLVTAIHMFIEAVFWFHPLIWWLGARLMEERERACDEEVLRRGCRPRVYAGSILAICKLYLASPVACISGVTGSDLKKRIELILRNGRVAGLSVGKKLALAIAGTTALIAPITIGALNATGAQQAAGWETKAGGKLAFEVASVKRSTATELAPPNVPLDAGARFAPTGGYFKVDFPLWSYIQFAYKLWWPAEDQLKEIARLPKWVTTERYSIEARGAGNPTKDQYRLMVRSLLADRFKLAAHFEMHEGPVLAMTLVKSGELGPKLIPHADGRACGDPAALPGPVPAGVMRGSAGVGPENFPLLCDALALIRRHDGSVLAGYRNATMDLLAASLSGILGLGHPLMNKTGLSGGFDFTLAWVAPQASEPSPDTPPAASEPPGPDAVEALRDQLGLKVESARGPVQILVIDRVSRPSDN